MKTNRDNARTRNIALLSLFVFFYLLCVPYLGQFVQNYRLYGTPFYNEYGNAPYPNFIERTYVRRPGVTSVVDAYLTFRIVDLIKNPQITNYMRKYPAHRTSLWTQFYGGTQFAHYDMWPSTWQVKTPFIRGLGRSIFTLGLIPGCCFIFGLGGFILEIFKGGTRIFNKPSSTQMLTLGAYAGFMILFTAQFRDYSAMKAIYVFPGMLCIIYFLGMGMNSVYMKFRPSKVATAFLDASLIALMALYCLDIIYQVVKMA